MQHTVKADVTLPFIFNEKLSKQEAICSCLTFHSRCRGVQGHLLGVGKGRAVQGSLGEVNVPYGKLQGHQIPVSYTT